MNNVHLKSLTFTGFAIAFSAFAQVALAQAPAANAPAATLPGGASSLQETFSDWQVACAIQAGGKRCALTQEQTNQQSRQRILAVEVTTNGDKVEGILLLPFGLALERGVTMQIDDLPVQATLKFRTCLPGGCLVPLSFDGKTAAALRAGTVLKAKATADGGADQLYTISLKGFAPALERVGTLSK